MIQLSNYFQRRIDINVLCRKIISNRIHAQKYIILFRKYLNWAEEHCVGRVTSDVLLDLIEYVSQNHIGFCILEQIVDLADGAVITDEVFEKLFHWPDSEERVTLLISLCHKKLNEKQLIALCETQYSFECFYELAALYYTEAKFSTDLFVYTICLKF